MRRLGVVILTYNSESDLPLCLQSVVAQQGVALEIIVVDNGSRRTSRDTMRAAFHAALPSGRDIRSEDAMPADYRYGSGLFVSNDCNSGYSAGNNIGARRAIALGCEAVLVINPDVRIERTDYLARLADTLFASDCNAVAASTVWNLAGVDENPMFEPRFHQELLAPVLLLLAGLSGKRSGPKATRPGSTSIPKFSGCCFLIRSTFLEQIGFFDENVFLYCEEAILAEQVRRAGLRSVCNREISAIHAHRTSEKGDPVRLLSLWAQSRRYYHARYLGTGVAGLLALRLSHETLLAMTKLRARAQGGFR